MELDSHKKQQDFRKPTQSCLEQGLYISFPTFEPSGFRKIERTTNHQNVANQQHPKEGNYGEENLPTVYSNTNFQTEYPVNHGLDTSVCHGNNAEQTTVKKEEVQHGNDR